MTAYNAGTDKHTYTHQNNFGFLVNTYRKTRTSMSTPRTVQMLKLNFRTSCREKGSRNKCSAWNGKEVSDQRKLPDKNTDEKREKKKEKITTHTIRSQETEKIVWKSFTRFFLAPEMLSNN